MLVRAAEPRTNSVSASALNSTASIAGSNAASSPCRSSSGVERAPDAIATHRTVWPAGGSYRQRSPVFGRTQFEFRRQGDPQLEAARPAGFVEPAPVSHAAPRLLDATGL